MNYLVFDVGGSSIKFAIVNEEYEILEKGNVITPLNCFKQFKEAIRAIYIPYREIIDGVAMSLPGMINKKTQKVQIPGYLTYNEGMDVLSELKSVTTDRFTIENDAKCAALCEATIGNLKDTEVGAVCILGSGVGGAITMGDRVLTGAHGFAGEFSYLSSDWKQNAKDFSDKWGLTGSVYTLIKKVAMKKGCDPETMDGVQVFELCNQGDEDALMMLSEYCDMIATGLYNIQATVDPDKIAIGGGISYQPILMEYLQKSLDKIYEAVPFDIPKVQIVNCKYYNDSNILGALANFFKTFA
ncbi:ROK family protein [[Eubacterium] hominis]|uniref:ROK family protein n=1 Tax=[Eubacterium] hominis TaxID=2764325 RepID=UPI003A4DDDE7